MALAVSSHEVRIAEILVGSAAPMTAVDILKELKTRFGMSTLKKSAVNTSLYGTAAYASVPGSQPPRWYVRGTPAADAAAQEAADANGAGNPPGDGIGPLHGMGHLPPPDVVPEGEFGGRAVVIGGDGADALIVGTTVATLMMKGAGHFLCLAGQKAGELASDAAATASAPYTLICYPGSDLRQGVIDGHRKAMAGVAAPAAPDADPRPACLVLIGPSATSTYSVHHILGAFETLGLPVFFVCAPSDVGSATSDCGAC